MKTAEISWTGLDLSKADTLVNPRAGVTENYHTIYEQIELGEVNLEGKTYRASAKLRATGNSSISLDAGAGKSFEIHIQNPASKFEPECKNPICHIGGTYRIVSIEENELIKNALTELGKLPPQSLGFYASGYLTEEGVRICSEAGTHTELKNQAHWDDFMLKQSKLYPKR